MAIHCVIPVKPYFEAKTRLSPFLSLKQRMALGRWLLRRTLRLARAVVGPVVVVSRDRAVLAEAEAQGAWGLPESSPGLNPALTQAARFARDCGATGILVLPTDLPCLTASDLESILSLGGGAGLKPAPHATPVLVIAPCRRATGTNALLMRPPNLIPFAFGPGSFAAHCAAARAAGVEPMVYRSQGVAFDLDTPQDWESGIWKQGIGETGNRGTGESGNRGARQPGIGD
jgi:2-phospho-L-lactate guanylyltransferase